MACLGLELRSLYVYVFLSFADVKLGVHEAYPTPFVE